MNEAVSLCWNKLKAWNQNCKVPTRIACLKLGTHCFIPWSYAKSKYFKVLFFFLVGMDGMIRLSVFCIGKPISCLYCNLQLQFLVTQRTLRPLSFALSMALLEADTQWCGDGLCVSLLIWRRTQLGSGLGAYLCSLTIPPVPFYTVLERISALKNGLPAAEHRKGQESRGQIGKSQIKTMSLERWM